MFSRSFAVFAVLATVAAQPVTDRPTPSPITAVYPEDIHDEASPWVTFPLFGNLFAPFWKLFPSFVDIGPKIISDEKKFEITINVKDYHKSELNVRIKGDLIFIRGSHEGKEEDHDIFATQFFHTYTLPANSSGSDVTATLTKDGHLIVVAPVNGPVNKVKDFEREVPIVESGLPLSTDEKSEKPTPTTTAASVTTAIEDDKKEPTTPSDKEDVTAKDNVIPHGSEGTL